MKSINERLGQFYYVHFRRYVINVFIHARTGARDLYFGLIFIDYVPNSLCAAKIL